MERETMDEIVTSRIRGDRANVSKMLAELSHEEIHDLLCYMVHDLNYSTIDILNVTEFLQPDVKVFREEEPGPLEWDDLWAAMKKDPEKWQLTTEHMYDEMLNCLPPRAWIRNAFLVGEPDHHNNEGFPVYACFSKMQGKCFARYLSLAQFNAFVGVKS